VAGVVEPRSVEGDVFGRRGFRGRGAGRDTGAVPALAASAAEISGSGGTEAGEAVTSTESS